MDANELQYLKVSDLRQLAKQAKIPKYSTMVKRELISSLSRVVRGRGNYLNTYTPSISYSTYEDVDFPITVDVEDSEPEIDKPGYLVYGIEPPVYSEYYPDLTSYNMIRGAYYVKHKDWPDVQRFLNYKSASRLYSPRSLFDISKDYVHSTFNTKSLRKSKAIPPSLMP